MPLKCILYSDKNSRNWHSCYQINISNITFTLRDQAPIQLISTISLSCVYSYIWIVGCAKFQILRVSIKQYSLPEIDPVVLVVLHALGPIDI